MLATVLAIAACLVASWPSTIAKNVQRGWCSGPAKARRVVLSGVGPGRCPQRHKNVRTSHSSGKNERSSALLRNPTPDEPPVPGLWPMMRSTVFMWRKRHC